MSLRLWPALAVLVAAAAVALGSASHTASADNGCDDPYSPGPTGGHIDIPSPWTNREAPPPIRVVLDDQMIDPSAVTLTFTKPDGSSFDLQSSARLDVAHLPNGFYKVQGHWQEPCYGELPDERPDRAGRDGGLHLDLQIPDLRSSDVRYYDEASGKPAATTSFAATQYCNQDPPNYKDEPVTVTVYYTTNGRAPTTSSPHFSDSSKHGCFTDQTRRIREHNHRQTAAHGKLVMGGNGNASVLVHVNPRARVRMLAVGKSGGQIVTAIRVRFVPAVIRVHAGPKVIKEPAERVKADSGSCPGPNGCADLEFPNFG